MSNGPALPQGPEKMMMEVKFSPRETDFIDLRFQHENTYKEIAAKWNCTVRNVKNVAWRVSMKLSLISFEHDATCGAIVMTKKLLKLGLITLEEKKK